MTEWNTADREVDALAALIWGTSRADESTISATGAKIVAQAILDRGWVRTAPLPFMPVQPPPPPHQPYA
jgi:hypothetical protein